MKLVRLSDFTEVKVGDTLALLLSKEYVSSGIKGENTIRVGQIVEPSGVGRFHPNMIGAIPPHERGYIKHHFQEGGGMPSWRESYPHIYGCVWILDEWNDGRYHQIVINYLAPNCDVRWLDTERPGIVSESLLDKKLIVPYTSNMESIIEEYNKQYNPISPPEGSTKGANP
jgi:hypothetical protein